jgi:hypothetical protein
MICVCLVNVETSELHQLVGVDNGQVAESAVACGDEGVCELEVDTVDRREAAKRFVLEQFECACCKDFDIPTQFAAFGLREVQQDHRTPDRFEELDGRAAQAGEI